MLIPLRWCACLLLVGSCTAQIREDFERVDSRFRGAVLVDGGVAGRAVRFAGGDGHVDVGSWSVSSEESFTLRVSLRTTRETFCTPLMARDGEHVGASLVMGRRPGCISFETWSWGSIKLISTTRVDDGQWHRVVAEYDAISGFGALSIDGRVEAVIALSVGASKTARLRLGNNIGAHQPFEGDLDSLVITPDVQDSERFTGLAAIPSMTTRAEALSRVRAQAAVGRSQKVGGLDITDWSAHRESVRLAVADALGLSPLPERLPLDPTIHGALQRDGVVVERVSFVTWPGYRATGWVWRSSDATGKNPAVLCPHGHWQDGALHATVRARGLRFARAGYVVLFMDSVHVEDVASGVNSVGAMTWNNLRALDYLEARSDVDPARIGVTGASGGAQQTMYLMALDDRPAVAAPVCMISEFAEILADTSAHCGCNHPPRIAWATDEPEMCAIFAPKPAFFGSVTGDWTHRFPEHGLPELARLYERYGKREALHATHLEAGHNYDQPFRNHVYSLFDATLSPVRPTTQESPPRFAIEELLQLGPPPRIPPARELMVADYLARRPRVSSLRDLAPALPFAVAEVEPVLDQSGNHGGFSVGTITGEDGVPIPVAIRARESRDALLIVSSRGIAPLLVSPPLWLRDVRTVAYVEPRFTGGFNTFQAAWRRNGLVLGRGEAYEMAHDIALAAASLQRSVTVLSLDTDTAPAALLAAHISRSIGRVVLRNIGASYLSDGNRSPLAPEILRLGGLPGVLDTLPKHVTVAIGGADLQLLSARTAPRHRLTRRAMSDEELVKSLR